MTPSLLLQSLRQYRGIDAAEEQMRAAFIAFVLACPGQCAERSHTAGHLTAGAWVVNFSQTKVLLIHHKKLNRWLQLGGHADGELDLMQVALREAREESGLEQIHLLSERPFDLDVHTIPARATEPEHLHYEVRFLMSADDRAPLRVSHESYALAWVPLIEIGRIAGRSDSLWRMTAKTLLRR